MYSRNLLYLDFGETENIYEKDLERTNYQNGGVDVTFKVNWKRTNRGLWLAGIAILIVAINIIIDNYQFNSEKEEIMDTVHSFTEEVAKVLVSPTDIVDGKAQWSEELIDKEEDEIEAVYEKYWTDTTVSTYVEAFRGTDEMYEDIEMMIDEMLDNKGYVKSVKLDPGTATINQYGPNGAAVTFQIDMEMEFKGIDTIVYGLGTEYGMYYWDDGIETTYINGEEKEFVSEVVDKKNPNADVQEFNYSGMEITVVLLREDGQWKIAGVSYY